MTRARVRSTVAVPVLAVLGGLLVWSLTGVDRFGRFAGAYGHLLNRVAVPQRHTTNVVSSVVFDYRGIDTMGEELILFAAVSGVVMLLRGSRAGEAEEEDKAHAVDRVTSDALNLLGVLLAGAALLLGLWLVAFGFVTPGGGFQGGVVIAGAVLLVYLATSYRAWHRLSREEALDPLEGLGVGGYLIVGLAALLSGMAFLHNLLGPGRPGTLESGGSLQLLNVATALEVAAANVLLFAEFLEQYVAPIARSRA